MKLNRREFATIRAALLYWQANEPYKDSPGFDHIATDGGTLVPMSESEIDALYERLNFLEYEQ